MKRVLVVMCVLVLAGGIMFAQAAAEEGALDLKLGHIRDTGHPAHLGAQKFAELVDEYSDGRITVRLFPNSQLGGAEEMFTQMQTGDLEMVYGGINTLAWISGGEPYEITSMPFLYRDYEHMRNALTADFFMEAQEMVEEDTGIKIVNMAGDTAPRGLSANREVKSVEDLQGMRIRTAASETALRLWRHFGALPEEVPYADLYMALRTGVVDAQENGALVVASQSFYEVQDYYIKTDYIRDIETFYMSKSLWDSLSEEEQDIIMRASEEAGELVTELTAEMLDEAYEELNEHLTVIEPPELDIESFQSAVVGLFDDWDGDKWPEGLLEAIRNM